MGNSGENALAQLNIIKQCLENFARLRKALDEKQYIREEKQKRRENNELD